MKISRDLFDYLTKNFFAEQIDPKTYPTKELRLERAKTISKWAYDFFHYSILVVKKSFN